MSENNNNPLKQPVQGDFNKAMQFYNLVQSQIGEQNIDKLTLSFPKKYENKAAFFQEFEELDENERVEWCNHLLREANVQYTKRDSQDAARKNILWTLMVCKHFNINLTRNYGLIKMIKTLWIHELTARDEVKDKLRDIFEQMGEQETEIKRPLPVLAQSQNRNSSGQQKGKKSSVGCGCMGNDCLLY